MNKQEIRKQIIGFWMQKAMEAIASAQSEQQAGRLSFAVNRAYYACFYSASAVLLHEEKKFKKHAGVRAAVHRYLVKTGKIDASWGQFYDYAFESRQRGDYQEMVEFESEQVEEIIGLAAGFIREMETLLEE